MSKDTTTTYTIEQMRKELGSMANPAFHACENFGNQLSAMKRVLHGQMETSLRIYYNTNLCLEHPENWDDSDQILFEKLKKNIDDIMVCNALLNELTGHMSNLMTRNYRINERITNVENSAEKAEIPDINSPHS